jgi:CRP-like cAMP-binding protein
VPEIMNSEVPPFLADPELVRHMEEGSTPVVRSNNRILFRQGDAPVGLFILKSGTAVATVCADGEAIFSVTVGPGALLGLAAAISNGPYAFNLEIGESAQIKVLSCAAFNNLLQTSPFLLTKVLEAMAREVCLIERALKFASSFQKLSWN